MGSDTPRLAPRRCAVELDHGWRLCLEASEVLGVRLSGRGEITLEYVNEPSEFCNLPGEGHVVCNHPLVRCAQFSMGFGIDALRACELCAEPALPPQLVLLETCLLLCNLGPLPFDPSE